MASYPADASTSTDPYAPFYYWDPSANDWAFDYASYYASYGYPTEYAQPAAPAAVEYDSNHHPIGVSTAYDAANATPGPSTTPVEQPKYDANGYLIPGKLKRGETRQTVLRRAAGKMWEDQTLLEWDPAHKRLFVGDLGNDVSDDTLHAAFAQFPTLAKAKVIRAKDGKPKGYGFVSFADPEDFLRAWKQVDGKYIGSRPCRIKKAADVVQPVTIGARKDRLLAISAKHDAQAYKNKMGGAVGKNLRRANLGKPYAK